MASGGWAAGLFRGGYNAEKAAVGTSTMAKVLEEGFIGRKPGIGRGIPQRINSSVDHSLNIATMPKPPEPYIIRRNNPSALESKSYGESIRPNFTSGSDTPLAARLRDKALERQEMRKIASNGSFSYFDGPKRGRTVFRDGSESYTRDFLDFKKNSVPAIWVDPAKSASQAGAKTSSHNPFTIRSGDAPWKQAVKSGASSIVDKMDGMTTGGFVKSFGRWGMPGIAGAGLGAGLGMIGNVVAPNNIEKDSFTKSAFKGAVTGMALGMAGKFAGGATRQLNSLGKDAASAAWMKQPLGMVEKVANHKITMAALGAASAGSAINFNSNRPLNGVM